MISRHLTPAQTTNTELCTIPALLRASDMSGPSSFATEAWRQYIASGSRRIATASGLAASSDAHRARDGLHRGRQELLLSVSNGCGESRRSPLTVRTRSRPAPGWACSASCSTSRPRSRSRAMPSSMRAARAGCWASAAQYCRRNSLTAAWCATTAFWTLSGSRSGARQWAGRSGTDRLAHRSWCWLARRRAC